MYVELSSVVRRAFDLLCCGISRHVLIESWLYNGKNIKLPFLFESLPDNLHVFETVIKVPEPSVSSEWFLKLVLSGNALVEVNGENKWGYDEAHTYFPIKPGTHRIVVRASPRSLFGYHTWSFKFEKALLVEVSWSVIKTGLWIIQLVDFIDTLPENNSLREDLLKLLVDVTSNLKLAPSPRQIALVTILLYEGPTGVFFTRRDLYKPYSDYVYLTGVYGLGILKNVLEEPLGNYTSINEAIKVAGKIEEQLVEGLNKLCEKYPKTGLLHIVGHSHIDAAWLWPRVETIEKVLRTFSTITSLMREYEFTYIQSSAQYYKWVEERDQTLFDEIKRLVENGKWIIASGMWVESDTNLVTGESLARQFLYGQRYFKEKLGRTAQIGFLPDSFGFSANLPQLLKKSGLRVFLTHKVMWNDTTKFPYHTFKWRGIDGTEIPVQIIILGYGEPFSLSSLYKHWEMYKDKDKAPDLIYTYGYSNGGGGPTREMLSYVELANRTPIIPKVHHMREEEYINILEKAANRAPIYNGELYLEFHRGTYTTNLLIKELVAKSERLLMTTELALSLLELHTDLRAEWNLLRELWKKLLFTEFHDVLPGSSIREVYVDAERDLKEVIETSRGLISRVLSTISSTGAGRYLLVFNPLSWSRRALIEVPADYGSLEGYECQDVGNYHIVLIPETPSAGVRTYKYTDACRAESGVKVITHEDTITLKNKYLSITVSSEGSVSSLKLNPELEILREPSVMIVHNDVPGVFDAWEVTSEFLKYGEVIRASEKPRVAIFGSLLSCVEVFREYSASKINQLVCVEKDSPLIRFKITVNWREKSTLVKHWFKTILTPMKAFYEIPFGVVERPTKMETPWEKAKFEVPAVSWADFTNGDLGIAIIAPSRHGYSAHESNFSLSLLRSPTFPNPWSDLGEYEFTYYLYPHRGDYEVSEVPRVALEATVNVYTSQASREVGFSLITIQPPRVLLSAFKRAEDGEGYVIRLYNPYSREVTVTATLGFKAKYVYEINIPELEVLDLIEDNIQTLRLSFKPFEVKTLKIIV